MTLTKLLELGEEIQDCLDIPGNYALTEEERYIIASQVPLLRVYQEAGEFVLNKARHEQDCGIYAEDALCSCGLSSLRAALKGDGG